MKDKQMTHQEPTATITPSDAWLHKQLEQIEQLQTLIIKQQSNLVSGLTDVSTLSIMLLNKINELQAVTGDAITPALEKAINAVGARAKAIDAKVPDLTILSDNQTQRKENRK